MDKLNRLPQKLLEFVKKNKYVVIVVVLGIGLLLIPGRSTEKKPTKETKVSGKNDEAYVQDLELRLEELLSMVEGAGKVRVLLTLQTGSRTEYQSDTQSSANTSGGETQTSEERKTVILSEGSAYDKAAISAINYPQFQGALILSEGAERAQVKLALIQAVCALTGLSSNQITVVKMK